MRGLHFHTKYKWGQNYVSPLGILEQVSGMGKARLRENQGQPVDVYSLRSKTLHTVIQLKQDINTLQNTGGQEQNPEAGESKRHPKCSTMSVSTERESKRDTIQKASTTLNNVLPLATNSCSITQKDIFAKLLTNPPNLAVLMKYD